MQKDSLFCLEHDFFNKYQDRPSTLSEFYILAALCLRLTPLKSVAHEFNSYSISDNSHKTWRLTFSKCLERKMRSQPWETTVWLLFIWHLIATASSWWRAHRKHLERRPIRFKLPFRQSAVLRVDTILFTSKKPLRGLTTAALGAFSRMSSSAAVVQNERLLSWKSDVSEWFRASRD